MPRITKTEQRWFDFPNDPDKGRVKFKPLTPGELDQITDESFRQDVNYKKGKGGKLEPVLKQESDKQAFRELPIIKSIVEWENFFEDCGVIPLECTPENIKRAIREIDGFKDWAIECRETLKKDLAKEKEVQAKNLKGSAAEPQKSTAEPVK